MIDIPTIDFSDYDESDLSRLAGEVTRALTSSGFMKITKLGISEEETSRAFQHAVAFFGGSSESKVRSAYGSAAENFGYQGFGIEHLDPSKPADLKETFTLRNLRQHDPLDPRWPTAQFRDDLTRFYETCLNGAYRIQRVFAWALGQEREFFVQYHGGENVSLRLLYYPQVAATSIANGQLGAGAHTDYGMITLLFQKDVGGLQVQDANGQWHDVEPENDTIVINTGDLMERWTNGRYRSTPHRVMPKTGSTDRFSIAMFVDPDTATPVSVLQSCIKPGEAARYTDITAGEHIQERIEASHKDG